MEFLDWCSVNFRAMAASSAPQRALTLYESEAYFPYYPTTFDSTLTILHRDWPRWLGD